MTEEISVQKSLTEQILDETFKSIEAREEFDAEVIQELRRMATSGGLEKAPQVMKAIKSMGERSP